MKVISYSLYGDNPIYTQGALNNCILRDKFFKDWEIRVYINDTVPDNIIKELTTRNVTCIDMQTNNQFANSMWRFLPASDNNVEYFISRDCDSRLSLRDFISVQEWIESGKNFHIIRDHPIGHCWKMNAGMWGAKGKIINNISEMIKEYTNLNLHKIYDKTIDQLFLETNIYPIACTSVLLHDEYFNYEGIGQPIKLSRSYDEFNFIGESVDEYDIPRGDQRSSIISRYKL